MNSSFKFSWVVTLYFVSICATAQVQPFEDNGKWGFKNKKGTTVVQPIYDKVADFQQSTYKVSEGKFNGIIDKDGKVLVAPQKGGWMYTIIEGFLVLKVGTKVGVLRAGEAVLPFEYSEIEVLGKNQLMAKKDGQWQLFNNNGKLIVKKGFEDFRKSIPQSVVKYNGKWAFMTTKNKLVYPNDYQSVEPDKLMYESTVFRVVKNNKVGIYTSSGEAVPCKFDSILFWRSEYNLIVTIENNMYGLWYFKTMNKGLEFTRVTDCLYPVTENTHLYDLIYGSDGCRHIPLIVNKKVYYYDTNSMSVSTEFYDSYDVDALMNNRVLKLTKDEKTIVVKGNRNCSRD